MILSILWNGRGEIEVMVNCSTSDLLHPMQVRYRCLRRGYKGSYPNLRLHRVGFDGLDDETVDTFLLLFGG